MVHLPDTSTDPTTRTSNPLLRSFVGVLSSLCTKLRPLLYSTGFLVDLNFFPPTASWLRSLRGYHSRAPLLVLGVCVSGSVTSPSWSPTTGFVPVKCFLLRRPSRCPTPGSYRRPGCLTSSTDHWSHSRRDTVPPTSSDSPSPSSLCSPLFPFLQTVFRLFPLSELPTP